MPNRIIKESICASDTIDQMTWFEECFWHRLIVNCDDYGRCDARPAVLKSKLFPLKERMTLKDVSGALTRLADIGCVVLYECDGRPYLYLPTWEVHQTIRAKKSRYPEPRGNVKASEIICKQMQADVPVIQSNPIQSESNPNTRYGIPPSIPHRGFDEFWAAYPRKIGKDAARKAFEKRKPDDALLSEMLAAVEQQKKSASWKKDGGQFIPHPATWLNQGRWMDEVAAPDDYYKKL